MTGQYLFFKYRANNVATCQIYSSTDYTGATGNNDVTTPTLNNDGDWHILVIDLSTLKKVNAVDGVYKIQYLRFDFEKSGGACWIEFEYVGYADSLGKIAELEENRGNRLTEYCTHNITDDLPVYEVVGDGSGQEYRKLCSICGSKCGKAAISTHTPSLSGPLAAPYCGSGIGGGWAVITDGIKEFHYVITNVNDPTETLTIVNTASDRNDVYNATGAKYGENRRYSGTSVTIADWTNVEGINFSGDTVKIECYAVSLADPTADPILLKSSTVTPTHKAAYGVWNSEEERYVGKCVCGTMLPEATLDATLYVEGENTFTSQWGTTKKVVTEGDITFAQVSTNNASGSNNFSNSPLSINPTGKAVSGQYMVIKYRTPQEVKDNVLALSVGGKIMNVDLVIDNNWHVIVVDLGDIGLNATSIISDDVRLILNLWNQGEYIQIDWVRMYDDYDRIPAEYKPAE